MFSFYGGQPGQSFKVTAIFPNRTTLSEDLKQGMFSPVGLNEYVYINYGTQNEEANLNWTEENEETIEVNAYNYNRLTDNKNYGGKSYNGTLWQKIIGNNLEQEKNSEEGSSDVLNKYKYYKYGDTPQFITEIEPSSTKIISDNGEQQTNNSEYKYICVGSFTGTTPIFTIDIEPLAPADNPDVTIDSANIDNPILTFKLPRAVKFWFGNNIQDNRIILPKDDTTSAGDYYIVSDSTIDDGNGETYNRGEILQLIKYQSTLMELDKQDRAIYTFKKTNMDIVPGFNSKIIIDNDKRDTYQIVNNELILNNGEGTIEPRNSINDYQISLNLPKPYLPGEVTAMTLENSDDLAEVEINKDVSTYDLNFKIPRGKPGKGTQILSARELEFISEDQENNWSDTIRQYLINNGLAEGMDIYKVQPVVVKHYLTDEYSTYWCTYNNVWSIQPLGGGAGTAILEWEELD